MSPSSTPARALPGSLSRPLVRSASHLGLAGGIVAGAAVAGLVLVLAACSSGSSSPDVDGRSFVSSSVRGRALVDGTTVSLTFHDGRLTARAGCNTLLGSIEWKDNTLVAPNLASTMMACEPDLMEQDTWLSAFLAGSPKYEITGSTLVLSDSTTTLTFDESDD